MQYLLTALALLAAAEAAPTSNSVVSLMALRSASPLHFQGVNANGGKFWVGKPTSTYCPSPPVDAQTCAGTTQNETVLSCSLSGSCAMNAIVPGGQRVFVDPKDGSLGYTEAHSGSMPEGALTDIFEIKDGYFNTNRGDLFGCDDGQGHYAVQVGLQGLDLSKCLGFDAKTADSTAQAWEYA